MNRICAYRDHINGTHFEAVEYQDPKQKETIIVMAEMKNQPGPPIEKSRDWIKDDVSKALHTTPDKITWYERNDDGDYLKYTYKAEVRGEHRIMDDSIFHSEAHAKRAGVPQVTYYSMASNETVSQAYVEGKIKDKVRERGDYKEIYSKAPKVEQSPLVLPERPQVGSRPWDPTQNRDAYDR